MIWPFSDNHMAVTPDSTPLNAPSGWHRVSSDKNSVAHHFKDRFGRSACGADERTVSKDRHYFAGAYDSLSNPCSFCHAAICKDSHDELQSRLEAEKAAERDERREEIREVVMEVLKQQEAAR